MSGQAAVGVAVSLVQVVSATGSVRRSSTAGLLDMMAMDEEKPHVIDWGSFAFFGLGTLFMVTSLGSHGFITRTKEYDLILDSADDAEAMNEEEAEALVRSSSTIDSINTDGVYDTSYAPNCTSLGVVDMLILNKTYNIAVAIVFIVTLVSLFRCSKWIYINLYPYI